MRFVLLVLLVPVVGVASAQGATELNQSAMELNRSGQLAEAAEVAARVAADETAPLAARCEALHSLIHAGSQLGRSNVIAESIATFDRTCADAVAGTWIEREVDRLRPRSGPVEVAPDDWRLADTAVLEANAEVLARHQSLCERSGADACLVVQRGRLLQEWYGPQYGDRMEAMSSTKSVAGLLAGMLIGDGKVSLDEPVSRFVPEWTAGAEGGVTLRHLLTMTSGLLSSHVPRPHGSKVGGVTDKDSLVFGLPLVEEPGAAWAYSNEGAYLLSPVLRRAAGEPLEDYASRRLFGPLGMAGSRLRVHPGGQAWTHATLWTTPRDLARIGQLMLQGGRWNGEQIVSESWVEASVQPSQTLNEDYGLLWWLDVPGGFAARGAYDTNVYVLPSRDLVVVRMQGGKREASVRYEPEAVELFGQFVTE